eukprot:569404-Prymnesium_polylepis.1
MALAGLLGCVVARHGFTHTREDERCAEGGAARHRCRGRIVSQLVVNQLVLKTTVSARPGAGSCCCAPAAQRRIAHVTAHSTRASLRAFAAGRVRVLGLEGRPSSILRVVHAAN